MRVYGGRGQRKGQKQDINYDLQTLIAIPTYLVALSLSPSLTPSTIAPSTNPYNLSHTTPKARPRINPSPTAYPSPSFNFSWTAASNGRRRASSVRSFRRAFLPRASRVAMREE